MSVHYQLKARILGPYLQTYTIEWPGYNKRYPVLSLSDDAAVILNDGKVETWSTEGGFLHRCTFEDAFSSDHVVKPKKIQANLSFATILKGCFVPGQSVMVLDTKAQLTSSMISLALGEMDHSIYVPQPNLQEHPGQDELAIFTDQSALEFIRDFGDKGENTHFWFDYCCTLKGNKDCCPEVDMELALFQRFLPQSNGVLAVTFSCRGSSTDQVLASLCDFLQEKGTLYGYSFKLVHNLSYNNMLFAAFVTQ